MALTDPRCPQKKLLKLEIIQSNNPYLPKIEITEDFDMAKLKAEIDAMPNN